MPGIKALFLVQFVVSFELLPKSALGLRPRFAGLLCLQPRLCLGLKARILHALGRETRMRLDLGRV